MFYSVIIILMLLDVFSKHNLTYRLPSYMENSNLLNDKNLKCTHIIPKGTEVEFMHFETGSTASRGFDVWFFSDEQRSAFEYGRIIVFAKSLSCATQFKTNTFRYTMCSAPNVYMFVYTLIGAQTVPLMSNIAGIYCSNWYCTLILLHVLHVFCKV